MQFFKSIQFNTTFIIIQNLFDFFKFNQNQFYTITSHKSIKFQVLMITIVCQRQVRIIQRKFLHHVLNQDMAWLDQHQIGALTEKVSA